jgi:hypothetical protein
MLLLYDDPSTFFAKLSPGEIQSAMDKYTAWRKKPFTVDAHRLGDDPGRVIRVEDGNARAMDGPYSETKEVLGGYYTINAANYDEAVKLALTHPHVELGGTIEVRHVFGT